MASSAAREVPVRGALSSLLSSTSKRLGVNASSKIALRSPFQPDTPFYEVSYSGLNDLSEQLGRRVQQHLSKSSKMSGTVAPGEQQQTTDLKKNDSAHKVILSDLPNVGENLLLQLACSRLGFGYMTAKDLKSFQSSLSPAIDVVVAVAASSDSWLAKEAPTHRILAEDLFADLVIGRENSEEELANNDTTAVSPDDIAHGYFNNSVLRNSQILSLAESAKNKLELQDSDSVLISITLCHSFGIASGVAAAFAAGATVVLPAVGGIRGCGVPSERAAAIREVLKNEKCSVLFSDAPIIKQLSSTAETSSPVEAPALRTGVVKVGSGTDFLPQKMEVAGVSLWTMGKSS